MGAVALDCRAVNGALWLLLLRDIEIRGLGGVIGDPAAPVV